MEASQAKSAPSLPHAYNLRKYSVERGRLAPEPGARAARTPDRPSRADPWEAARSSAPSLPHAFNLRKYSADRGRLVPGPSVSAGRWRPRHTDLLSHTDLLGGNGRWRQRRAKEQWVLDQAEAERQRRAHEVLEGERKRRSEEREAARRKQQQEDQQRQQALEEERRRERLAAEERERQEKEERRLKAEQEHSEWLARQPKTCAVCAGSGKCPRCGGKGFFFAMFLAPSVDSDAMVDFGRAQQGCPECGGCAQNVRADVVQGSGKCHGCDGVGTVAPEEPAEPVSPETRSRRRTLIRGMSDVRRMSAGCRAISLAQGLRGQNNRAPGEVSP